MKQLRKELKLSQQEFGERINISRGHIAGYETGKSNIPERTIRDICREFNVSEEWLKTGEGEIYKPTPKLSELIDLIDKFPTTKEDDFKIKTIKALLELDNSEWEVIEKLANKISKDM